MPRFSIFDNFQAVNSTFVAWGCTGSGYAIPHNHVFMFWYHAERTVQSVAVCCSGYTFFKYL